MRIADAKAGLIFVTPLLRMYEQLWVNHPAKHAQGTDSRNYS